MKITQIYQMKHFHPLITENLVMKKYRDIKTCHYGDLMK